MQRMWFLMCLWGMGLTVVAAAPNEQAKQLELKGDGSGARTMLSRAAQSAGAKTEDLWAYAEFLDRHGDPASREAYEKLSASLGRSGERTLKVEDLFAVGIAILRRIEVGRQRLDQSLGHLHFLRADLAFGQREPGVGCQ